jgi:quinolinate synthase
MGPAQPTYEDIARAVRALKAKRHAVIVAHNYQPPQIYDLADFIGDSLELARRSAAVAEDIIVFCGVHFMAESAKILSPHKTVLLPEPEAGCTLAEFADADGVRAMKAKHPRAAIVSYVNSSAAVKAESDICCTSANAVKIVESLDAGEVILLPDGNLARYVQTKTRKTIIPWPGTCCVHDYVTAELLATTKAEYPNAKVMVHPECRLDVIALGDYTCSTGQMLKVSRDEPYDEWIVVTDPGMCERLRRESPHKTFHPVPTMTPCYTMNITTPAKVRDALFELEPAIEVPEAVRVRAERALRRMIEL